MREDDDDDDDDDDKKDEDDGYAREVHSNRAGSDDSSIDS